MTYEIRQNPQFNSSEVYFDSKPCEEVRSALKNLKFRWHSVKKCWYGYASEEVVADAILAAEPETEPGKGAVVVGDGYLGGGSVYGSKSNKALYGSELSAAVRADIKKAGIKGVTVSCKSYSGGQSLTLKVKLDESNFVPFDEFLKSYDVKPSWCWLWDGENSIHVDKYFDMSAAEQEETRVKCAKAEYLKYTTTNQDLNQFRVDDYKMFNKSGIDKLHRVKNIVEAYRYDNSNSMVDYFDTNFYYDICTKVQ